MSYEFTYKPAGEVLKTFLKDESYFRGIRGPVGSGTSSACCVEIFRRASQQIAGQDGIKRTRFAIIRNTNPQLKTTTVKTWLEWFPEKIFGKFNWSVPFTHSLKIGDVECEVIFLALDRPDDVDKLLSLDLTGVWINEAREISKSVVDGCTMRCGRYPSMKDGGPTWYGVIADTNAPSDDHWWPIMAGESPIPDYIPREEATMLQKPDNWKFFTQPAGMVENFDSTGKSILSYSMNPESENTNNLTPEYYNNIIKGKTKSWIDVYVMNRLGHIQDGKPVYPMFAPDVHVAKEEIPVAAGVPLYVGVDFGLTPAAVFGQKVRGRWLLHSEIVAIDMGIVRFAEVMRNELATRFAAAGEVIIYGDPAGDFRAQTDESTPFHILRGAGLRAFPTHSNSVDLRLEAVSSQLTKMVEGKPVLLIDRRCPTLIKGFESGYAYKRMEVSGERYADKPDKNMFSHVHDAAQYLFLGAGEGRALMNSQKPAQPTIAQSDFNVFKRGDKQKRRQGLWSRM